MNRLQEDPGPSFMQHQHQHPVRTGGKNLSFASTPSMATAAAPKLSSAGKNLFANRGGGGKPRAMAMSMASSSSSLSHASKTPTGGKNLSLAGMGGGKPMSASASGGKNMSLMAKRRSGKPSSTPTPQTHSSSSPPRSQQHSKPKCQKPCGVISAPASGEQPKTTTTSTSATEAQAQNQLQHPNQRSPVQKAKFTAQLASMQSALNAVQTQMQEIKKLYSSQVSGHNGLKLKIRRGGEGSPGKSGSGGANSRREGAGSSSSNSSSKKPDSGWGSLLPEVVLFQIFKNLVEIEDGCLPALVRASKVCRLWRSVASKHELWTNVDLRKVVDLFRLERNLLFLLENRFSRVRHLNLGGWPLSSTMVSGLVSITGKSLQTLQVPGCEKLTAQHLQELSDGCVELRKLDLSGVSTAYNTKSAVTPSALQDAFSKMRARLVHLSVADNCLANCQQIVQSLAEHCPNLQVLDLSNVSSPRRDSIQVRLEQLQIGCPNLKVLRLTNTDITLSSRAMEQQQQSQGFVKLEELSIAVDPRRCPGLDDNDLERIVKGAQGLKLFDVRGCGRISDSAIVRVPAWDLQHLFLSGCSACKSSSDGLELIVRKWRHSFVELDLSWTPSEQTIALALAALAEVECPTLKVLNICGSSVTLPTLKAVLAQCPSLESLNLTSCRALPRGLKRNYGILGEIAELRKAVEKMESSE